ncbi:MAG: MmcQ/YjbR family DNA-binding protein [Ewingella americana]|uniref:YjbR family protein n=2 Tax=Ewingella americana TaxID=41202 RepID=A0A085G6W5_EWIA3|nr:MmcQ/YjbR family DNA-binding protein [Ewingella americana]KAA8727515.1 MmcQ/YjbR family DNA-binding protein [Ewingella americana]KFC79460.1 YjbR family protein [Ewingella americana ATCC 33852]MCI1679615.1 MmcQ/YjbR family DNA-binding protein [Ewingella americana]MCI1854942.1 MmcQ/YjbR family DNA-binding protein [Ewingella americana]MCI1861775.1 MmcQ/YjbR family DNA-binding protein [Ewingella americana]
MTNEELLDYCLGKPGAEATQNTQRGANQIKVADVMFAMFCECNGRQAISLKTSAELADDLRAKHECVIPGDKLNKAHWNTIYIDGDLPDSQFYYLIDSSYQLVVAALPEETRHGLGA